MIVVEKDPNEKFNIGMDFAPAIPTGKSLTTVTGTVFDEADGSNVSASLLSSMGATLSGTQAILQLRGGADGHVYRVVLTATLDDGEVIKDGFVLSVKAL